ncbi:Protein of unknown function [Cotesia congregata]|uniref:Uncharacterized protein n=1 Tax=Cotesia congregata TaxID=51543 RepID=A0A8J2HDS4_COTCN|nr:Protein of unknown function [Cotesia congregata]
MTSTSWNCFANKRKIFDLNLQSYYLSYHDPADVYYYFRISQWPKYYINDIPKQSRTNNLVSPDRESNPESFGCTLRALLVQLSKTSSVITYQSRNNLLFNTTTEKY